MELTKQDRKTLELFSWYAKGYGKEKVSMTFYFDYDGSFTYQNETFYDEDGGSRLDSYETIDNLLNRILDELDIPYIGNNPFHIKFFIDCIEKELTVELFEDTMIGKPISHFDEFPETEGFNSLAEYMKQKGYSEGIVEFNGSGDDGYIEDLIYFDDIKNRDRKRVNDFNRVEDFLYNLLNDTLGGWEINEGSYGTIHFNLEERTVVVEMMVNEMGVEEHGVFFRAEF